MCSKQVIVITHVKLKQVIVITHVKQVIVITHVKQVIVITHVKLKSFMFSIIIPLIEKILGRTKMLEFTMEPNKLFLLLLVRA